MIQRLLKETARYILYYMTLIVVVTSVLFIMGIKISCMNVIMPMFMISIYIILRKDIAYKEKIIIVTIASVIVTLSVMVSMGIYDFTVDGNAYHKQAVGLLKDGWNPVYQISSQYNELVHSSQLANNGPLFWSEVYPKATWYYAAAIYAVTEKIEAGKSYTILFIFVVFGYSYDFFYKVFQKKNKSIILSLIMVANPIVLAQLGSYYLDGFVALVLSLLAIIMIDEVNAKEYIKDKWTVICLLVWGCNLKFSVILFVVTYCLVYIGYRSLKSKQLDWRNMILLGTTGLFSIFVVGNSPYYTNLKRYENMLHGLEGVIGMANNIQGGGIAFFSSIFSKMSGLHINTIEDAKESLKLPFTVYRQEFDRYYVADVRRGGMGIFFSGLFVISIFLILLRVSKYKKNKLTDQLTIALILFGTNIIEMIILPKTSELRYVPHIYLSIVLAMVILYKMNLQGIWFKFRMFLNFFLIIIIALNALPWVLIGVNRIKAGVRTTTIFENMAYECVENGKIFEVRYCNDTYNGLDYNLNDFDIRYYYNIDVEIDESFKQNYLILYNL